MNGLLIFGISLFVVAATSCSGETVAPGDQATLDGELPTSSPIAPSTTPSPTFSPTPIATRMAQAQPIATALPSPSPTSTSVPSPTPVAVESVEASYTATFADYISLNSLYPHVDSYAQSRIVEEFERMVVLFEMESLANNEPITQKQFDHWLGNFGMFHFTVSFLEREFDVLSQVDDIYRNGSPTEALRGYADPTTEVQANRVCDVARDLAEGKVYSFLTRDPLLGEEDLSCKTLFAKYLSDQESQAIGYIAFLSVKFTPDDSLLAACNLLTTYKYLDVECDLD